MAQTPHKPQCCKALKALSDLVLLAQASRFSFMSSLGLEGSVAPDYLLRFVWKKGTPKPIGLLLHVTCPIP